MRYNFSWTKKEMDFVSGWFQMTIMQTKYNIQFSRLVSRSRKYKFSGVTCSEKKTAFKT
jgi:hypothetical protein